MAGDNSESTLIKGLLSCYVLTQTGKEDVFTIDPESFFVRDPD